MASSTPKSYFTFESRMRLLASQVQQSFQWHIDTLSTRREQILKQLEHVLVTYTRAIEQEEQQGNRNRHQRRCDLGTDFLSQAMARIMFQPPDPALEKALGSMGVLLIPSFGPYCKATGDGLEFAVPSVNTSFTIATKDCFNEDIPLGGEEIAVEIMAHTGTQRNQIPHYVIDHNNGKYTVNYCLPRSVGPDSYISMSIEINGLPMGGSPFRIKVQHPDKLPNWRHLFTFGDEGNEPGYFCRPWGVAITRYSDNISLMQQLHLTQLGTGSTPVKMYNSLQQQVSLLTSTLNGNNSTLSPSITTSSASPANSDMYWNPILGSSARNLMNRTTNNTNNNNNINSNQYNGNNSAGKTSLETTSMASSPTASSSSQSSGPQANGVSLFANHQQQSSGNITSSNTSSLAFIDINYQQQFQHIYLIGIADRSNNRIQLFKFDSNQANVTLVTTFGSGPGSRAGQFDRPAGIVFDTLLGHIIVADKDNHRVQVFDMTGRHLYKFGERGTKVGQFCYPWDIDVCRKTNNILVSDTRNRRIQIFDSMGHYLNHFSHPLDSPRGVAFLSPSKLIISDFNKHRLLMISTSDENDPISLDMPVVAPIPKHIGFGEGSSWGEFLRPQGVAYCGSTVYCSDSRNNRITCWNEETQTFTYIGNDVIEVDRPAGLAAIDDYLVIVDFGNNRVHLCQH